MAKISRREFTILCGGTLTMGALLDAWPGTALASSASAESTEDLTALSLVEASARIHSRRVTPTQLTKAQLARIAIYNPKANAYITVMAVEALKQAAELDQEQKAGKFRGPLHGIPIALKDNIDTAGTRTTAASPMFRTRVPTEDAEVVRKLKAAGAIILGKLTSSLSAARATFLTSAQRATRGRSITSPAARRRVQAQPLQPTYATLRSAPTQAAASACPPPGAASSASSPPPAWSPFAASFLALLLSTTAAPWRAPLKMWP